MEQKLEWGNLYTEYINMIEKEMEYFISDQGGSIEELFDAFQQYQNDVNTNEFIPQFLMNTNYDFFIENMKVYATNEHVKQIAIDQGNNIIISENFREDISGV